MDYCQGLYSLITPTCLLTMDDSRSFPTKFFSDLVKRSESDTSVVATLRRSLMFEPGTDARTFPLIERWTAEMDQSRRSTVYLAAGLWAQVVRQGLGKPMLFPEAMRRVRDKEQSDSIERRFTALLDADADELRWRLRSAVTLIASQGIALAWPSLLGDMLKWHYSSRSVQIQWSRSFWRQPGDATSA